jgi:hypothetical protein
MVVNAQFYLLTSQIVYLYVIIRHRPVHNPSSILDAQCGFSTTIWRPSLHENNIEILLGKPRQDNLIAPCCLSRLSDANIRVHALWQGG